MDWLLEKEFLEMFEIVVTKCDSTHHYAGGREFWIRDCIVKSVDTERYFNAERCEYNDGSSSEYKVYTLYWFDTAEEAAVEVF